MLKKNTFSILLRRPRPRPGPRPGPLRKRMENSNHPEGPRCRILASRSNSLIRRRMLKFGVAFRIRRRIMKSRAEFGAAYQSVPCRIRRRRIMRCRIRRGAAHTKFGVAVHFGVFLCLCPRTAHAYTPQACPTIQLPLQPACYMSGYAVPPWALHCFH